MKYIKEQISAKEKTRYMFAIGKSEAKILYALLDKAIRYMPRTFTTKTTEARMRDMISEIRKSIPDMKSSEGDDYEDLI